ncbi:ATP-dependent RNA helicase DDX19A [Oncorhynchus mykiss]|uniref:ATP-dependent RNA helicase DDX19A n=1 Tax=Oncorhynchus mykiss TaxID=8022 RepID=UPI001878B718|nr:ATP-dependent RNA helicase DDX19A [Oncorhynchus mykiss]XP_036839090.1 ATP-dependent RNA helicase DDX19A [Oncorhynchus mykiss]
MLAEPRLLLSWPCSVTSTPTTSFLSVCVSPTYELALQTGKVIEQMGKYSSEVKLVYAIRGNKHKAVGWLAGELSREGHQVALLSGEMQVEQRAAVIDRFREGREKVLVTNNVCARGIDVEQVSVVLNFDLPVDRDGDPDNETYLHRLGRTGRFGKRELAINMVDSKFSMNVLNKIQDHFNKKIEKLDTDDLDEIEKIAS